ncbi:MAG: DUF4935 domain-containing protein [Chitinophagaceae bacterium]|nr:DUF4935 domain-containing protein [Chitinophagaceae bacterium]
MHILLDTNILIGLLASKHESYLISRLDTLVNQGKIEILIPEILLTEWEKKKIQTIAQCRKSIDTVNQHSTILTVANSDPTDVIQVEHKAQNIDELLGKGIIIKSKKAVKSKIYDRIVEGRAPFHNGKTKSLNDAILYLNAIEYLKAKSITEFAFFSKDVKDFGYPEKDATKLHPQLIDKEITVHFYQSLESGLRTLSELNKISYDKSDHKNEGKYIIRIVSPKSNDLLTYLYEVLKACEQRMPMIPLSIFSRVHPLRISNYKYNYTDYSNNTLTTNNIDLFNLFRDIDVKKMRFKATSQFKNSKQNKSKLLYILKRMNAQQIEYVNMIGGSQKSIDIRMKTAENKESPLSNYESFLWNKIISKKIDLNDKLEIGFTYYRMGLHIDAINAYYEHFDTVKKNGNPTTIYVAQFCLQWLCSSAYVESNTITSKIINECNSWNLDETYFKFAEHSAIDREIALYFQNANPIQTYATKVSKVLDSIRGHYFSQLFGSVSGNNNFENLVFEFTHFIEFVSANRLTYTHYSDFNLICNNYTEGVLLSYALNEYQPNRLEGFDDKILETLLKYGNADKIIEIYVRFIKHEIRYLQSTSSFMTCALAFLSIDTSLIQKVEEKSTYNFYKPFFEMFWSLIALLSTVKFKKEFIISCFEKIFIHLRELPKRETHKLKHLSSFLHRNWKILSREHISNLFMLVVSTKEMHSYSLFDTFNKIAESSNYKFFSNRSEFDNLLNENLTTCEKCGRQHDNILITCHKALPTEFRNDLKARIEKQLDLELNFDLYYKASIFEIIDYNRYFEKLLGMLEKPTSISSGWWADLDKEIKFRRLNELLNLVYKNSIHLPPNFINKMKGLSHYYDWLLDMKNFDYKKFNPLWVAEYTTEYYLRVIFKNRTVCRLVQKYLKTNFQPKVANLYSLYAGHGK